MSLIHVTLQVMLVHKPILTVVTLKLPLDATLEPEVAGEVGLPAELSTALEAGEAGAGAGPTDQYRHRPAQVSAPSLILLAPPPPRCALAHPAR